MIERILKHMNIYREMKNAAIPLKLIGKKGEDSCMNAARLVNQQELSSLMEGLNEETISSLMDDPEILISLGKMNKKDFSILEPDRIRMIVECAGNENLNTLNEQNLRDCEYMVVPWRKSEGKQCTLCGTGRLKNARCNSGKKCLVKVIH